MKLIVMSTGGCAPCRQYRQYVKDNFTNRDIGYYYVDAREYVTRGFVPEEARALVEEVVGRVRSVPHSFIVDNEGNIQEEWVGFNPQKVNEYAYQTRPKYLEENPLPSGGSEEE